ncbi:hypothetical protein BC628DRAFT_91199 [Trametes gibbosa]|nr:hypothetical protein BC628DRAFT_91199 [Trametes gibbosa]
MFPRWTWYSSARHRVPSNKGWQLAMQARCASTEEDVWTQRTCMDTRSIIPKEVEAVTGHPRCTEPCPRTGRGYGFPYAESAHVLPPHPSKSSTASNVSARVSWAPTDARLALARCRQLAADSAACRRRFLSHGLLSRLRRMPLGWRTRTFVRRAFEHLWKGRVKNLPPDGWSSRRTNSSYSGGLRGSVFLRPTNLPLRILLKTLLR